MARTRLGSHLKLGALALTLAAATVACGSGGDTTSAEPAADSSTAATSAAEDTGSGGGGDKLVVYATTVPDVQARLVEGFTAKTGIEVESLRLATGALAQRFMEEQSAGQHVADVITLGDEAIFRDMVEQDLLEPLADVPNHDEVPEDWKPDEHYVLTSQSPETILYNTDLVTGDLVPDSWDDLLRPEFKGQILMADPRNNPVLQGKLYLAIESEYGEDFFRKLGEQDLRYTPNAPAATEAVAAGEGMVVVPGLAMNLLPFAGTDAPVATVTQTPSPTNMLRFFTGIVSTGPNPDAARQWVEYVLSPEGQQLINADVGISFYGPDVAEGSFAMPDSVVEPTEEEAAEALPRFLELLGIGA